MSLVGFKGNNHPQQIARGGVKDEIDDRGTDPLVFSELDSRFRFTLDAAADSHNAKCKRYYTKEIDGLLQPWDNEIVWCNPPYSNIEPWVKKSVSFYECKSGGVAIACQQNRAGLVAQVDRTISRSS